MLDMGVKPSQHTYDGLVKAAINAKGVAYGINLVRLMQKIGLQPYNDTYAAISIGCSRHLNLDLAEDFCKEITDNSPKYIHTFTHLLTACDTMGEPERAIRVLARLKHMNIKKNIKTYELMFSLFGTVNSPFERGNLLSHADVCKRINIIETDMTKNGIQHSYTSLKNLIKALGAEGLIREMLQYLNFAESMLWQMDAYKKADLYDIVLHALVNADETPKAIEVFKSMKSSGLPATVVTYNTMIECCSTLESLKSAFALLSLMLRDGFPPQKITFDALIKVMITIKDFEGALGALDNLLAEGIEPDIQLFNTILREAYFEGRIDIIEFIIESIHRMKILPDPSTLWYTFSAYVECDFHNTAIEALQVLSMRMISKNGKILDEDRIYFEELVYSEDPDVEVHVLENCKDSKVFFATALLNLRWCAMMGSSISWSPNESPWAKRISSSYETRKGVA